MKLKFCAIAAIAGSLFASSEMYAQHSGDVLTINTDGIRVTPDSTRKDMKVVSMSFGMVDLGLNLLMDNTNYASPAAKSLLAVPDNMQNKSLFDLRTWKSVNVNIYPWMVRVMALKTKNQRIYVSSSLGLQLYNFRYENPITWVRNPVGVTTEATTFHKDKLALNYLSVPLMVTFKTRLQKDNWLVYGAGLTEGFLVDSWTKQESGAHGRVKVFDQFGLNRFNTCITAEIGLEGEFRMFFSYQVTNLFQNGLDQHPLCIGFRFGGI